MLKLFCDECVSKRTIALLRSLGYAVLTAKEAGLSGSADSELHNFMAIGVDDET